MALRVFLFCFEHFIQKLVKLLKLACLSTLDVANRISGPKIIQFDGVDVSRRPKCDCNHDYDFQYFFFTEVSRGASRILFLFLSSLHKNCSKPMLFKINIKLSQKHVLCADVSMSYVWILARLMCRFEHVLCADFSTSYV